ncbi:MAG: MBL fold metallo-hydrolase [Ilumatobacter sp.]
MDFVTLDEDDFSYGVAAEIMPGVSRVIAHNPSKFTYRGTGVYIIGSGDDVAVVDPGPALDDHRAALATALDGKTVRSILVTHCHADHSPLAKWLAAESGAPTYAYGPHAESVQEWDVGSLPDDFGRPDPDDEAADDQSEEPKVEESTDTEFAPDVTVRTGDVAFEAAGISVRAVHTPGHTSNHTCFALASDDAGKVLFTGDHVMGWSTTVVSPPDGHMGDYIESLRVVAGRSDDVAVPTHGAPIPNAASYVGDLVEHRLERERQVVDAVRRGVATIPEMVTELYAAITIALHRPAAFSVLGHIVKLVDDGVIESSAGRPRLDASYTAV